MAAFIVISTDNRLSGLVEGIEKCLPLNPDVHTYLSTGKVEEQNDGSYKYHYNVYGDKDEGRETSSFHDLVLNQVAAFRKVYGQTELLNILTLENPMSSEESNVINAWMYGLEDVFRDDTNIRLHRALFTYDLNKPYDVAVHIPSDVLDEYLKIRNNYEFKDSSDLIVIGNRNMWGAAVSLKKEEHDFKMPRFLADFMMLLSSDSNSYGVYNVICSSPEKCVALGWAESMYYFPDMREYYEHADRWLFYKHILNDPDHTAGSQNGKESMDVEKYPVGLYPRKEALGVKYNDVPFFWDIDSYKGSADFTIESCLSELKELVEKKREAEFAEKKSEIDAKIQGVDEDTSPESGIEALEEEKAELQKEMDSFEPQCPEFVSRKEIYEKFGAYDPNDEEELEERGKYMDDATDKYSKLVKYITSKDFYSYVEKVENDRNGLPQTVDPSLAKNPGCLWIFRRKKKEDVEEIAPSEPIKRQSARDSIKKIRRQLELKDEFQKFLRECETIESEMAKEEEWCKNFKLTDHSNHYYHLINLDKLKKYQEEKFDERFHNLLTKWDSEKPQDRTFTQLKKLLLEATIDYTHYYRFIDWNDPFKFVSGTDDGYLRKVCDELHKLSSPFVHYETISVTAPNDTTIALYSDMPNIVQRFNSVKGGVVGGNNVLPYLSTHIASKLCYFQFLPLAADTLDHLVKSFDNCIDSASE